MCGMSKGSYVTSTGAVRPAIVRAGIEVCCRVNVALAVISVGPEMVCAPLGLMLSVTGVSSLPEHAVKIKDTAARIRVRIDASAQVDHAPATKLSGTLLFLGSVLLSTIVRQ